MTVHPVIELKTHDRPVLDRCAPGSAHNLTKWSREFHAADFVPKVLAGIRKFERKGLDSSSERIAMFGWAGSLAHSEVAKDRIANSSAACRFDGTPE